MTKFKYTFIPLSELLDDWFHKAEINKLGANGWELVCCSDSHGYAIFKKPYEDDREYYLDNIATKLGEISLALEEIKARETILVGLLQESKIGGSQNSTMSDVLEESIKADDDPVNAEPKGNSDTADIIEKLADERIELAMKAYKEDDNDMGLVAVLMKNAGLLPVQSTAEHYHYMLKALYRYYLNKPEDKIEEYYADTLNKMAGGTASIVEIDEFFEVVCAELEHKKQATSPFRADIIDNLLKSYIEWAKTEPALCENAEKMSKIGEYIRHINREYGFEYEEI